MSVQLSGVSTAMHVPNYAHRSVPNVGYAGRMTQLEKGPLGLRRGRGARERILGAARQLFRDQGINSTGLDQLCAVAQVSKRTFYQHFSSKDELIAEHLRRFDPDVLPEVFDRIDSRQGSGSSPSSTFTRRCARSSRRPSRVLDADTFATAAAIATVLVNAAIPAASTPRD
jgi:AcrR family transcriptional regulator